MEVLKKIHKRYNDEALFLLNSFPRQKVESIPTGSLLLDQAIGVGGIPRGRYSEIYGTFSAGKTSLCQHIAANVQKQGLVCAYIDVENSLDFDYASACGVDFDKLYISQPSSAEEALGIAAMLIDSGEVGAIIIDSVAGLSPEKEGEGDFEDKIVTGLLRAKLLTAFFRQTVVNVRKNKVAVVFTNQVRDNTKSFFGGVTIPGGRGLQHYASVRLELKKKYKGEIKRGDEIVGQVIEVTVKKNKVAAPWKKAEFTILAGTGIDHEADILDTAVILGVLHKRGAFYIYEGETLARGKYATILFLKENPEMCETIEALCKEILNE